MRVSDSVLEEWLDKLRTDKLQFREVWRLFDDEPDRFYLRYRNPLTEQFHYNPLGLLLRTSRGKRIGRFLENEFSGESTFFIKGLSYTPYFEREPQSKQPLPLQFDIGPQLLRKHFGFLFLDTKDSASFGVSLWKNRTFEEYADWLEVVCGKKTNSAPTHSNPLLAF